jgi:type IV pilus assembly protein PilY1
MRPSSHGDVVHSRPVAINFGTDAAPQVVVFYGGNDGILRAVNGNRSASIGSVTAGSELWAFMPPEFYPYIKRIRDNTTPVSYFGIPPDVPAVGDPPIPDPEPKPYGFDGAIAAYQDTDNVSIYATMRRGGRVMYAFDVTSPASPALKWKRGCPNLGDDTGCSANFSGIGQTWSAPKILKAAGHGSGASPVLMLGGGYDACEDSDPHTCTSASKGNKIYVLDADDGTLLNTFDTDRGLTADIFVVPDSATGLAKHAYAADLGGNLYRINIGANAPASWTITKIASLGGTGTNARKFMFAPDVVESNGEYVLLLGSGDREKPLVDYASAAAVSNYFFMVKDDPTDENWLESETDNCGTGVICLNSLVAITDSTSPTLATVADKKGWYLALSAKEQVVTSAITIFGTVTFSTHTPATPNLSACTSNLGDACVYNIAYANAASMNGTANRCQALAGGGLPPSPVAGMVTLDAGDTGTGDGTGDDGTGDDGTGDGTGSTGLTVPFCIGCSPESSLEGGEPPAPPTASQPKSRVYWYIQQ